MHARFRVPVWVLAAVLAAAAAARAQDYAPPTVAYPLPLYHNRPETGGFYLAAEFLYFQERNYLRDQIIAQRGFFDADGSVTGVPGTFDGSGTVALRANDVGASSYTPGLNVTAGWRFASGLALEVSWWNLNEVKYAAGASIEPQGFQGGIDLADTFVTAPVFNFPPEYAGEQNELNVGNPGATFGIWNAASAMTIQLSQRFDQFDITARVPIFQNESTRFYGIVGPRITRIWEKFKWRTVSMNNAGISGPEDVAVYSNVVSNRLYGAHFGCGDEWRLGDTPAGTFAVSLDAQAALLMNFVKERAKYEREDRFTSAHKSRREYTVVPELQAQLNLWWYPIEGVQMRIGYDVMAFFNTVYAPYPVNFNYGGLDATYERTSRFYNGFHAGIGFIF